MKIRIFLKSVMRDWHPTECLWKAVSILYLAITEITVRTAGMVISEISIRNILWERYGLSFPRKINLDFERLGVYERTVVPWSYDQGKETDAGGH